MSRKESWVAAVLKIVALVGGIQAISMECVHREFNALLRDLGWDGCLDREACKVLDLADASEALSAAIITDRMRLQETTASSLQIEKGISTRGSEGAGGKQDVSCTRQLKHKTPTTPLPPVDEESGQQKNKKQRRDGAGRKMYRDEHNMPAQRVEKKEKKGKDSKAPRKNNKMLRHGEGFQGSSQEQQKAEAPCKKNKKPRRMPVMTQRVEEKEEGGKDSKANRPPPQGKAVNTGSKISREERSTVASMRQFDQMDRKAESSTKLQQRKDRRHTEDQELEASIIQDLIDNPYTMDSKKHETPTKEMQER